MRQAKNECALPARRFLALVLLGCLLAPGLALGSPPARNRHVLLLFANEPGLPANVEAHRGFQEALTAGLGARVNEYVEYLDVQRFPGQRQEQENARWLRQRYRDVPLDLVVALGVEAMTFLVRHREQLWSEVPIVFAGVPDGYLGPLPSGLAATGTTMRFEWGPTVEAAVHLVPGTRRAVLVSGSSPVDEVFRQVALRDLAPLRRSLEVVEWRGLTVAEMERRAAVLPDSDVLLFASAFRDGTGRDLIPADVAARLAEVARRPMFTVLSTGLGRGIVGGRLFSFEAMGRDTGALAVLVLDGERAAGIPVRSPSLSDWRFDERAMRRFGLSTQRLPPGSEVLWHTPTAWEEHRKEILGILAFCGLQSALILVLLAETRRRRRSEALNNAVLASQPGELAVLDPQGRILSVNEAWRQGGGNPRAGQPVGSLYVQEPHLDPAARQALGEVLQQGAAERLLEYSWSAGGDTRLGEFRVRRLERPEGGAVVSCQDITLRKRAEAEVQRHLHEASHAGLVAAMGELAGALAHELNQPLAASLGNAQATRRLLAAAEPELGEVREALDDVIAENLRARDVMRRMRSLMQKGEVHVAPLDLGEVASEVARLTATAASLRGICLALDLQQPLPRVEGDRVQLQQVALNLVMNALDACEGSPDDRRVLVRTLCPEAGKVGLEVRDTGPGLEPGRLEEIFQPYFTTKKDGMGLGLSICRTIVEVHGGSLTAENHPEGGAVFRFTLPATAA